MSVSLYISDQILDAHSHSQILLPIYPSTLAAIDMIRQKKSNTHTEVLFSFREEWSYVICMNMDGTGDHILFLRKMSWIEKETIMCFLSYVTQKHWGPVGGQRRAEEGCGGANMN